MKVFVTNRLVFNWLCICPSPHELPLKQRILQISLSVYVLISEIYLLLLSVSFFYKTMNYSVNSSNLYTLIQMSTVGNTLFALIHAHINRHRIEEIFVKLEDIYERLYSIKIQNKYSNKCFRSQLVYLQKQLIK